MENETKRDFSDRTDALAVRLGMGVAELADHLGMSRASFFGYRSGQRPISGKAWAKLTQAEEGAGIFGGAARLPGIVHREPQESLEDRIQARIDEVIRELEALKKEIAESRN